MLHKSALPMLLAPVSFVLAQPGTAQPAPYRATATGGSLVLQLAPKSVTVVRLQRP